MTSITSGISVATLTADRIRSLLDYDQNTGVFTWKVTRTGKAVAGLVAGSPLRNGYYRIQVDGKSRLAHRLAWLHVYGDWPDGQIDHINGVKADNRIANLREATASQNGQNQRSAQRNSRSGKLGVYLDESTGRWRAVIAKDGQIYRLGYFDSLEDAHGSYLAAKRELHEFGEIAKSVEGHLPARSKGRPIKAPITSKSGILGATFSKTAKRWRSSIRINGKRVFLGYFDTANQAGEAYRAAREEAALSASGRGTQP